MATLAVIVNGIHGSGKTTLATGLAVELGFPVVSKDAIKEALANIVPGRLPTRRIGALASDTMWSLAAMIDGPLIIESFWATDRDEEFFERGVETAGIEAGVEVWCEVSIETARRRFEWRPRHPVYGDAARGFEWEELARQARPISRFPTLEVNTESPVDVSILATELRTLLGIDTQR